MVFCVMRRRIGPLSALMIGGLVIVGPVAQYVMTKLLLDGFVGMLMFASILALARYFSSRSNRYLVLYGLFAAAATLTKAKTV
jgi:hypothetical protein